MSRSLLASCLFLFAALAMANTPVVNEDPAEGSAKSGKTATISAGQDSDSTATAHPVAIPTRNSTPRTPRWHSLLPGMIR